MSKQSLVSKAVHLALVVGAAGLGSNAMADDQTTTTTTTNNSNTAQLGKIEVTGTKIKRTDVEQAQPVTLVTSAQIKATGLTTIGAVIQKLTSSGAALNTLDNFGGNFTFTGGGASNVDLRNLGAQRVLVLVNGKRWATGLDGTVDLNSIPASVIDHIEVLQDGASTIYGSDAIAGVVNIITVKDYNGRDADAYMGIYHGNGHSDGKTSAYDFTMGSSNDKNGLVFNVAYTNQESIPSKNRNISKEPVIGQGASSGSSAIPNGRFVFLPPTTSTTSDPANTVDPATGLTAAQCPTSNANAGTGNPPKYVVVCDLTLIAGAAGTKPSDFRNFVSHGPTSDRFNYAPFNFVLTPEERYSTYMQGYSDLADNITFKADMMYSHRDSRQQAAPEPLFFASSSINVDIPANQKYNPFGFDLNTASNLGLLGRRMVENGDRLYHEKEDVFHIDMGLTGFFNIGGKEWDWDANYAFSKDSELDTNAGHFDVSHLLLALGDPAKCAAVTGCVPLDLFGGAAGITKPMLQYVAYTAQNQFENNQRVYNADITNNDLFSLPGGGAGLALGLEYLEHDGFFQPDSVAQNGYDSFNPGRPVVPTSGRTSEKSLYGELDLPLVADAPAAKLLDLDLAGRHTNYDTFGSDNTYRWGLKYQPNNEWLVRATWSQGFRAPSIQDLFSGNTNLSANIQDPCDAPAQSPVCAAQGVPSTYTQPNAQINTLEGGNPHLNPERSVSRTIGFVYSPDWMTGFNLSMDYYKIEVDNTIQPISGQVLMDECYTAVAADSNPAACAKIVRSPTFGTVTTLADQITNVGTTITEGIDVNLTYTFPSTSVGDFKLGFDETHIKSYRQITPDPAAATGADVTELSGTERGGTVFPFGIPKNKARMSLNWVSGSWSAEYDLRFVGAVWEPCLGATQPAPVGDGTCSTPGPINPSGNNYKYAMNHDGATVYHDIQGSYTMDSIGTTFSVGIRNLFGKEPPISSVQELNSFDPTLYDVPGQFIYGRISVKF